MKFIFLLVVTAITQYTHAQSSALNATVTDLQGKTVTLDELREDKALYVKIWASWCASCMEQMPHFNQIHQKYGPQLKVISINLWVNEDLASVQHVIKEKDLRMPTFFDRSGELAHKIQLAVTPVHALFDAQGNLVHLGHKASQTLDEKLSLIANGTLPQQSRAQQSSAQHSNTESTNANSIGTTPTTPPTTSPLQSLAYFGNRSQGRFHVLFTSTWCHSYLKKRRPEMAKNCEAAADYYSEAFTQTDGTKTAAVVVSNLWTQDKDLASFKQSFKINTSVLIDPNNQSFYDLNIRNFPTLVVFKNGKEVWRETDFSAPKLIDEKLKNL